MKDLKPKEQTKAIEGKSRNKNNQSIAANIFNNLIKKGKSIMNEFYESVDKNKLYFQYVGPTKDVGFYEYYDSKQRFNEIENNRLRFDETLKKKKEWLNKINEVKMGNKTPEQNQYLIILKKFIILEERLLIFLKIMLIK